MKRKTVKLLLAVLALVLIPCLCSAAAMGEDYVSPFANSFWSLVPPIIAIALALITKEVYSSLFIGILSGALLYANFHPIDTLNTVIDDGLITGLADRWTVGIFLFLVILGILVSVINKAGGSAAFGRWAKTHIKSKTGAALASFVLGVLIFVDDYFNCLTVGSVMRPVTDGHKISRAKLAYIIDATAAPVCMIAPISSWAAAVSGMVDEGVYSGIELFVRAIPYNFYSLLTLIFVIALSIMKFDYGPMRLHEKNAEKGDLFTVPVAAEDDALDCSDKGRVIDLILPILILIVLCVIGMLYVGGFWNGVSFVDAFAGTDASLGLPWGALVALVVTIIYLLVRGVVSFKDAMGCVVKGFNAMVPALIILTFATTLKNLTGLLGADVYVAELVDSTSKTLYSVLPAVIFVVACFLAFSTGTSWGTFGILIPIVVNVFPATSEMLIIGVSACLAGAVCGDHCSPISDTTIMASAGAQCDHVSHVSTQLPYAITVAAVSFVAFLLTGFIQNIYIMLPVSIVLLLGTLFIIRALQKKA